MKPILINKTKSWFNQLDYIFFYLSLFTLTLSIKYSSKFLFIALVFAIIKSFYKKDFDWVNKQKKVILINTLFFIYICFQGIVLMGFQTFFSAFERQYAPYIILILLPLFYSKENKIELVPKVLIAGIFFIFFLIVSLSIFQREVYNRDKVLEVFDLHHLYISLYILFAINYIFSRIFIKQESYKLRSWSFLILIILYCFLFFFKSKSAIVIALFLFIYHLIPYLKWNKQKIITLIIACLSLIGIFNNFFYKIYLDALDFRLRIWNAALEIIMKKPLFGNGGNNEQILLNKAHFINGNYDFLDSDLNTHNQFLTFTIKFGIIGLFLIITTYIIPLLKMKDNLKKEYIGFLTLLFFIAFIESLYNRHHGIVFCTVMLYYYNVKSSKHS